MIAFRLVLGRLVLSFDADAELRRPELEDAEPEEPQVSLIGFTMPAETADPVFRDVDLGDEEE